MPVRADFRVEIWKLRQPFSISRDTTEELALVHCMIQRGTSAGRSEAVGVDYHGETPASLKRELEAAISRSGFVWDRHALLDELPAGGARNALDCALWDLEAKELGRRAWELAGLPSPHALRTTYTIGLAEPAKMAADVALAPSGAILKLKLGARDGRDVDRVAGVREASPQSEIVVDVNEAWSLEELNDAARAFERLDVRLIEQPLSVADDASLDGYTGPCRFAQTRVFPITRPSRRSTPATDA